MSNLIPRIKTTNANWPDRQAIRYHNKLINKFTFHDEFDKIYNLISYFDNKILHELGNEKNGKKEGNWTEFYNTGLVNSKGSYNLGEKNGHWNLYMPDGSYKSGSFKNSKLIGNWTYYDENGIIIFSGSLYLLSISGIKLLGAITPIGGLLFIAGWITLFISIHSPKI